MAEPFIGEIKIWGLNYSPRNWAYCDGQIMEINQNAALYALLGSQFGGDDRTYFKLPDFRGRAPIHPAPEQGIHQTGLMSGLEYVRLTTAEIPSHKHGFTAANVAATEASPANALPAEAGISIYANENTNNPPNMNALSIDTAGSDQEHYNIQPSLVLNFCIALLGIFPSRN